MKKSMSAYNKRVQILHLLYYYIGLKIHYFLKQGFDPAFSLNNLIATTTNTCTEIKQNLSLLIQMNQHQEASLFDTRSI